MIQGTTHLCQGQEAVSVGAISALEPKDYLTITYRGHGHALARGMPMEAAFGELMGLTTGCCNGVGGSMHLTDFSRNLIGSFAIIGAGLPVAVGAAMSARLQGRDAVALSFCGDGATNIGTFHEALNMASLWKAPVVFMIENNLYGEYSPLRETTPLDDLADRAQAPTGSRGHRRRPGRRGGARHGRSRRSSAPVRGDGPTLIEAKTYRYRGHSRTDPAQLPPRGRARALAPSAIRSSLLGASSPPTGASPSKTPEQALRERGPAPRSTRAAERAARRHRSNLRGDRGLCLRTLSPGCTRRPTAVVELSYREAICAALDRRAGGRPDRSLLMGEDVATAGGVFKTSEGLLEQFGPGADPQHADLRERLRRRRARDGGHWDAAGRRDHVQRLPAHGRRRDRQRAAQVPLHVGRPVRRAGHGPRRSAAPRDGSGPSTRPPASRGSWAFPGLQVATASHPGVGLRVLRAAIRDDDPVLFFEHKGLYGRGAGERRATLGSCPIGPGSGPARGD